MKQFLGRQVWQERFDLLLDTTLCEDCIEKKDGLYQPADYHAARYWNPGKECNLGGCKEAVNIRARLGTLTICIRKMMDSVN